MPRVPEGALQCCCTPRRRVVPGVQRFDGAALSVQASQALTAGALMFGQ